MLEVHTEIDSAAPPERVGAILMDFATYPQWNPFIKAIVGPLQPGAWLAITIQPAGSKPMRFAAKLLAVTPRCELRWRGRLFVPCVLDGEHRLAITPRPDGTTRFSQGERFSGLLVGLMRSGLTRDTQCGFEAMNEALKARAESVQCATESPITET